MRVSLYQCVLKTQMIFCRQENQGALDLGSGQGSSWKSMQWRDKGRKEEMSLEGSSCVCVVGALVVTRRDSYNLHDVGDEFSSLMSTIKVVQGTPWEYLYPGFLVIELRSPLNLPMECLANQPMSSCWLSIESSHTRRLQIFRLSFSTIKSPWPFSPADQLHRLIM